MICFQFRLTLLDNALFYSLLQQLFSIEHWAAEGNGELADKANIRLSKVDLSSRFSEFWTSNTQAELLNTTDGYSLVKENDPVVPVISICDNSTKISLTISLHPKYLLHSCLPLQGLTGAK